MARLPPDIRPVGALAFVTDGNLHLGRLSHDRQGWTPQQRCQTVLHPRNSDAADLFVIRDQELQRCFQLKTVHFIRKGQHLSQKALHICRAAPKQPVTLACQLEGWHAPALPGGGHHVGMGREQKTAVN